jgi:hypothetical protein
MQTKLETRKTGRLSREEGQEYLVNLRILASELDRAMKAVVDQELPSLQDSLQLQQATCAQLSFLAQQANDRPAQELSRQSSALDPDLAVEIRDAAENLIVLNRNYSALLRHSEDTLRLFVELFRCYQGSAQSSHSARASISTWSCEL